MLHEAIRVTRWCSFARCLIASPSILNMSVPSVDQRPVEVPRQVRTVAEGLVAGASAAAHRELRRVGDFSSVGRGEMDWSGDQVRAVLARGNGHFVHTINKSFRVSRSGSFSTWAADECG